MELRQLVYFDAIVRFGGFTRAADHLHVAQPAISAQIRRLESELGTELLERSTRKVSLTHAGELFRERVLRVLEELDSARAEIEALSCVLSGRVRIGATQILGSVDLPATMAKFGRQHPGVSISLSVSMIAQLLQSLDAGEIDLVLGPMQPGLDNRYVIHELAQESLVLVRPVGHPEPDKGVSTLLAFRDEPFVCLPPGSGLHAMVMAAASELGFAARIMFETYSPAGIRELVSAGLGVAVLASSAAYGPGPQVEISQHQPPVLHPPICLVLPRGCAIAPAAQAFEDHLQQSLH